MITVLRIILLTCYMIYRMGPISNLTYVSLLRTQTSSTFEIVPFFCNKIPDIFSEINLAQKLIFHVRKLSTSDFPNIKSLQAQKFKGPYLDVGAQRSVIWYPQSRAYSIASGAKVLLWLWMLFIYRSNIHSNPYAGFFLYSMSSRYCKTLHSTSHWTWHIGPVQTCRWQYLQCLVQLGFRT